MSVNFSSTSLEANGAPRSGTEALDLAQQHSGNFINRKKIGDFVAAFFLKAFFDRAVCLGPSRDPVLACGHFELPAALSEEDSH